MSVTITSWGCGGGGRAWLYRQVAASDNAVCRCFMDQGAGCCRQVVVLLKMVCVEYNFDEEPCSPLVRP